MSAARADLHVHSSHSNKPSIWAMRRINCPESFTAPAQVYAAAKGRGMDFVTITDHNTIAGAMEIAHLPGAFVSAEISSRFPDTGAKAHVVALDIDETTFGELMRVRASIYDLVVALRAHDIVHFLAHPVYDMDGRLSGSNHPEGTVYRATSADSVVDFTPGERRAVFQALFDTIPTFRPHVRIFTPRCALRSLIRQRGNGDEAYPWRGGREFFFVDARGGDVYPCGYRGEDNLGKLWDLPARPRRDSTRCRRCDWECFRDPSELLGPLHQLLENPQSLFRRVIRDRSWFRLWCEDLRYCRACSLFDGRRAPDLRRLGAFAV